MIKLIITDLDGTFLNSQGSYDKALFTDVKRLMAEKGVQFAACTGKQCERVEELFAELSQDIWIIGDSATRIKYNGEFIYQSLIANSLGRRIIERLKQVDNQPLIIACTEAGAVIERKTPPYLVDRIRQSYRHVILVDDLSREPADFIKISVYDEHGRCPETRQHLNEFNDDVYMVVSEAAWIDIADAGVHKGTTVEKLQQHLKISRHETMAFGDGYNDLELLAAAEYSFAMRNAFDETKAAAQFITGSNDENAVQRTIQKILALQP